MRFKFSIAHYVVHKIFGNIYNLCDAHSIFGAVYGEIEKVLFPNIFLS